MTIEEDDYERALSFSHHGGKASGLESAEATAKQRAGQHYASGNDAEAKFMRDVAIWLGGLACDARKEQKKYQKMHSGGV